MQLAKLIIPNKINKLGRFIALMGIVAAVPSGIMAQDNSPYSRYGLGDLVAPTNVNGRAMGGVSAALSDALTINYNNPAAYGSLQAFREPFSKKMSIGRAILDVGLTFDSRTLTEPENPISFKASNAVFSHVQLAMPIRPNWGIGFGIRPMSRISYKVSRSVLLTDPVTGNKIDSAHTLYQGDGGLNLAHFGTGKRFRIDSIHSINIGGSIGYLFGRKDYSTRLSLANDTVTYANANAQTKASFGNVYYNIGINYQARLKKDMYLSIGGYGNIKTTLKGEEDRIRETFAYSESAGYVRVDSVSVQNQRGDVIYPSSYTAGFALEKLMGDKSAGWLVAVDYVQTKWSEYSYYGTKDASLQDTWEIRAGVQLRPIASRNYFSNVAYRAGFNYGPDYVKINGKEMNRWTASLGMGLPIFSQNRFAANQATMLNLAFEMNRRGNNDNVLKENLYRVSVGFSLSDLWFRKNRL